MADELRAYVKEALSRNVSRETIGTALQNAGWTRQEIAGALEAFADDATGIPVPRRRPNVSAREAFIYLTLFLCLAITAFGLGSLAFHVIDRLLPQPGYPDYGWGSAVRMAVASMLVAGPVYLLLLRANARELARDPAKRRSPVRQWLTYLTLFLAGAVSIGDLISLLYNLFEGDLPLRFVLKSLTVLALAGATLLYHLRDLKKGERS